VDTLGLLIYVMVHSAGIQDRDGAKRVFEAVKRLFPWFEDYFCGWRVCRETGRLG
jgi:putative transposase